jgi:hypothetical protein
MVKKFSMLLAAVAVLAIAVPAMANATELNTKSTGGAGTRVPVNTVVTGTGANISLTSSTLGTINCKKLNLKGKVTVNNGTTVEASNAGEAPEQETCLNGTKPVNVTNVTLTKLFSNETGKGTASFTAVVDIKNPESELKCTFTGTNVPGTWTSPSSTITFSSAAGVTSTPAACGTAKLDGAFTLEVGSSAVFLI